MELEGDDPRLLVQSQPSTPLAKKPPRLTVTASPSHKLPPRAPQTAPTTPLSQRNAAHAPLFSPTALPGGISLSSPDAIHNAHNTRKSRAAPLSPSNAANPHSTKTAIIQDLSAHSNTDPTAEIYAYATVNGDQKTKIIRDLDSTLEASVAAERPSAAKIGPDPTRKPRKKPTRRSGNASLHTSSSEEDLAPLRARGQMRRSASSTTLREQTVANAKRLEDATIQYSTSQELFITKPITEEQIESPATQLPKSEVDVASPVDTTSPVDAKSPKSALPPSRSQKSQRKQRPLHARSRSLSPSASLRAKSGKSKDASPAELSPVPSVYFAMEELYVLCTKAAYPRITVECRLHRIRGRRPGQPDVYHFYLLNDPNPPYMLMSATRSKFSMTSELLIMIPSMAVPPHMSADKFEIFKADPDIMFLEDQIVIADVRSNIFRNQFTSELRVPGSYGLPLVEVKYDNKLPRGITASMHKNDFTGTKYEFENIKPEYKKGLLMSP
eukprot:TRINITY_DN6450_c0_g1_i2.p1 TRINITY_DN6450_c0_g1~~TRINITY_DN6450_c0_g1_i2.p1  ORF type:complete len:498 (-),score=110.85 TRINITY_DN6450_c0_g1_i2:149-1642(-)